MFRSIKESGLFGSVSADEETTMGSWIFCGWLSPLGLTSVGRGISFEKFRRNAECFRKNRHTDLRWISFTGEADAKHSTRLAKSVAMATTRKNGSMKGESKAEARV